MNNDIRAYEMEMLFSASVGLKQINDLLHQTGLNESLQIKDAITISIKQTLLSVPNGEYIQQLADIIKNNYETNDINLTECRFTGYKYLKEVRIKKEEYINERT